MMPVGPAAEATAVSECSVLLDIGSGWTKGAVVARARGRWRIVAAAAQPSSWSLAQLWHDLALRLAPGADPRLVPTLEPMLAAAPRIECHTPRRAGRLAICAAATAVSGATARRAAESAGWLVTVEASLDDGRSVAERLRLLSTSEVDAWLLVGGFEDASGAAALEMAGFAAAARRGSAAGADGAVPVIWAGASQLAGHVASLFEEGALTAVANPRPSSEIEEPGPLRRHLEGLLERTLEPGGTRQLATISFRRGVRELAREMGLSVLGVDLGARYASWVHADSDRVADARVFASGGLTAPLLTSGEGPLRVSRLLPVALDELAVADALQNLAARPSAVPQTDDELTIAEAAGHLLLGEMANAAEAAPQVDLIVGSGRLLAATPRPSRAAQLLLDGLRPLGVTQLALDAAGALAPLGSLDDRDIGEGIGTLRDDLLVPLGAAVVSRGGRPGQPAMRVHLHRPGWPDPPTIEVRAGSLSVLPLPRGVQAELEVELLNGAELGTPRRSRRARTTVTGGVVGLIVDARGAPLSLPRRIEDRRGVLAGWRDAAGREAIPQAALR